MKVSESHRGLTVLFLGRKDKEALCCFPGDQSGASQLHEFCSSNSKTNREDKGAGEDLGLQGFEWHTSCFVDDV